MSLKDQTADLRSSLKGRTGPLRPVLTLLNGDQSWLLSFPRPSSSPDNDGKKYFHIVNDPWLHGNISMFSSWIIGIEPAMPAAAANGAAVEDIIREIEEAATGTASDQRLPTNPTVDAIFIHHHLLDHYHPPSLLTFPTSVPVFAVPEVAPQLRKLAYFDTVVTTNDLDSDSGAGWQALHPGAPLPPWLNVFRLPGHRGLNIATAYIWSHDGQHEVLLNTPHGIRADLPNVRALFAKEAQEGRHPPLVPLAMLAPLKDSFAFGQATTLGFAGSLALEELMRPRYWIRSSDALLKYKGLMMLTTYDVPHDLEDAKLERRPIFFEVKNGASLVLE